MKSKLLISSALYMMFSAPALKATDVAKGQNHNQCQKSCTSVTMKDPKRAANCEIWCAGIPKYAGLVEFAKKIVNDALSSETIKPEDKTYLQSARTQLAATTVNNNPNNGPQNNQGPNLGGANNGPQNNQGPNLGSANTHPALDEKDIMGLANHIITDYTNKMRAKAQITFDMAKKAMVDLKSSIARKETTELQAESVRKSIATSIGSNLIAGDKTLAKLKKAVKAYLEWQDFGANLDNPDPLPRDTNDGANRPQGSPPVKPEAGPTATAQSIQPYVDFLKNEGMKEYRKIVSVGEISDDIIHTAIDELKKANVLSLGTDAKALKIAEQLAEMIDNRGIDFPNNDHDLAKFEDGVKKILNKKNL